MVSLSPNPGLAMTPFLFAPDDCGGGISSLSLLATISRIVPIVCSVMNLNNNHFSSKSYNNFRMYWIQ